MNCRPGDIAVIVEGLSSGVFVDVLAVAPCHPNTGEAAWEVRIKAPIICAIVDLRGRRVIKEEALPPGALVCIVDSVLRPIRPPPVPATLPPILEEA